MRVGVISDTHGLLQPAMVEVLTTCDCILHGGDINCPEILEQLRAIAPLYVVRGNNDQAWAEALPQTLQIDLAGVSIFMVHNKKDVPRDLAHVDVVVFGHSHQYFQKKIDGCLWLNPGSCGKRRFNQEITMAVLTITESRPIVEKIQFHP